MKSKYLDLRIVVHMRHFYQPLNEVATFGLKVENEFRNKIQDFYTFFQVLYGNGFKAKIEDHTEF